MFHQRMILLQDVAAHKVRLEGLTRLLAVNLGSRKSPYFRTLTLNYKVKFRYCV